MVQKVLCSSLEDIPQEVYCSNNTTRIVLCGEAKVDLVCYAKCVRIWKNIFKIRWDQEEVFAFVIFATQRITKGSVLHQLYANLENILRTR